MTGINKNKDMEINEMEQLHWYVVRATHGRAAAVYEYLVQLGVAEAEPYLPSELTKKYDNSDMNNPHEMVSSVPLINTLLFVRCNNETFRQLLKLNIPGFTPYYDHFHTNIFGRNDYLTVPDIQFANFRTIIESGQEDIIIDQNDAPTFLKGDKVVVTGGPYEGLTGIVMKYKHQKRVFVELDNVGMFGTGYIYKGFLKKIE